MREKYLNLPEGPHEIAFELTEYLRGELFVCVHGWLCHENELNHQSTKDLETFFLDFLSFVTDAC